MSSQLVKIGVATLLALGAGGAGYVLHGSGGGNATSANTQVFYSLDAKANDQQIISVINGAKSHVYFAIYEFTLQDIADALVAAKERGVDVEGLVDSSQNDGSVIVAKLQAAGIPVETEKHADGEGIMHIKAVVTDSAYALGSYNWTLSATKENDELLEVGTDPGLVATYTQILKKLLAQYQGNAPAATASTGSSESDVSIGTIDYTDAPNHIGATASVRGMVLDAYQASSGTVFFDYCKNYKSCPFSAVVFASDASKFAPLSKWSGKAVTVTGKITSYQGKAEMVLSNPSQISQ